MDFYQYYLRRMETQPNKKLAIQSCKDMVVTLFENGPTSWSIESGAAFLAALHEVKAPGVDILPIYNAVEEALFAEVQGIRLDLEAEQEMAIHNAGCSSVTQHIDGPDNESEEGLSKYFLDFEHIETWGAARWAAFMAQIDTVVDVAATDLAGLDSIAHLLTEIRANFDRIPVDTQEQALIAADKLVLAVRENMESLMDSLQDKRQTNLSESMEMDDWDGENNPAEDFIMEPPDGNESATPFTSELLPNLDLSGWGNWSEGDWMVFDQAVADAQVAATAKPSDPAPALHLFLGIRQNIETLERHRRFAMGNTADDLMEVIKKGMAQDLFQIQKKCPYSPRPMPIETSESPSRDVVQLPPEYAATPTSDDSDRRWKKGRVGRELVELNFDHLDKWNLSQWAAFKIQMDKMTAAAEASTDALGQSGQLLEDIRAHIGEIPQHYIDDVTQMVTQLVQTISGRTSETLTEILRYCGQDNAADRS